MKVRTPWAVATLVVIGLTLAVGCPPDDDPTPPELFPVEPETAPEEIESHLLDQRDAHLESTDWIEATPLYQQLELPPVDRPPTEDDEQFEQLVELIGDRLLIDEHLESQTDTELIYTLEGQRVCQGLGDDLADVPPVEATPPAEVFDELVADIHQIGAPGPAGDPAAFGPAAQFDEEACAQFVDDADIRLRVTSPAFDEYRIGIQTTPQRLTPAAVAVGPEITLVDIDVGDIGNTLADIADSPDETDEVDELDQTDTEAWTGRLQWSFQVDLLDQTQSLLVVPQPVSIQTDDFSVELGAVDPAFSQVVDAADRQAETFFNLGDLEIEIPVDTPDDDETIRLTVGDISTSAQFVGDEPDRWQLSDVGAGQPLSIDIDDREVFELQRIPAAPFDAVVRATDEGAEVATDRPVEWFFDFLFEDQIDVPDRNAWLADDTWTIALDDSQTPTIGVRSLLTFEVLEGRLVWESSRADRRLEVDQGMCLVPADETGDDDHPVELFEAADCP